MSRQVKFDPERPVRITGYVHGRMLRTGRPTFFHVMSYLWRKAKAEYDSGEHEGPRVKKFEEYATTVAHFYELSSKAMDAGHQAVEASGLDYASDEARKLERKVENEFASEEFAQLSEYFGRIEKECEAEMKAEPKRPLSPVHQLLAALAAKSR